MTDIYKNSEEAHIRNMTNAKCDVSKI